MDQLDHGEEGRQILKHFRKVAKSHAELFKAQRDHVYDLLGKNQNYASGIFRESLFRNFLASALPSSVSVDSGFVYGFEQAENSRQIDILVWNSAFHAPVYRTKEVVIIPPEAVIAAISVKTNLNNDDLRDSLSNLLSLTPLEILYRSRIDPKSEPVFNPITKIVVSYEGPKDPATALDTIGSFYEELFAKDRKLACEMSDAFRNFDPLRPSPAHTSQVERVIPKLIASIDKDNFSCIQGWGPPEDRFVAKSYGQDFRRLPYMYRQENKLTSPLEKVVYHVLTTTYTALGTPGLSLSAAWGELNPVTGSRSGDADEILVQDSVRLLDPERLAK